VALNAVLASDEVSRKLSEQGAIAGSGTAAGFADYIRGEQARYAQIVKDANIRE
jgi:tripartite-type tricarboxylate transporter receptor subunit TctC